MTAMKTLMKDLSKPVPGSKASTDIDKLLQEVSDDSPLSLGEAIEWLNLLGLRATPQKLRQAHERYRWVDPLQAKERGRKRYSRQQLHSLVFILGLREVGLTTRQIDALMNSLREVTQFTEKKKQGQLITENDRTRWESASNRLQKSVSEALKLGEERARALNTLTDICKGLNDLLNKKP